MNRLDPHRVLADGERAQFIDRVRQRAGQRPAEIGDADPLDPAIGLYPQRDDRALAVGVVGGTGQGLVGRQLDQMGSGPGYLHGITSEGEERETLGRGC